MNLFTNQKQIHRHRKQIYGYQEGKVPLLIEHLVSHFVNLRKGCQVHQELEKMCFATRGEERKETRKQRFCLVLEKYEYLCTF